MNGYDPKVAIVKDVPEKDEVWLRDEIDSPCVKLCVIHPEERLCVGCYRTIEEISQWSRLAPEARAVIMADLAERAPRLIKRRGGRMGRLDRSSLIGETIFFKNPIVWWSKDFSNEKSIGYFDGWKIFRTKNLRGRKIFDENFSLLTMVQGAFRAFCGHFDSGFP